MLEGLFPYVWHVGWHLSTHFSPRMLWCEGPGFVLLVCACCFSVLRRSNTGCMGPSEGMLGLKYFG